MSTDIPIITVHDGSDNPAFEVNETNGSKRPSVVKDFLSVSNPDSNNPTYVYEPERDFHQMTLEAFPTEENYRPLNDVFNQTARPTIEELMEGQVSQLPKTDKELEEDGADLKGKVIKFGWVEGVLMRCLLNIWGTMLFLRLTWVIGQAGIWKGLLIITLCNVVTLLSAISMSAVATNGQIAAGGVYYMISRALGPSLGGSIGLMFTIANTISVATYTIGFAESLLDFLQDLVPGWDGIVTPLSECSVAGCRPNDVRIIGAPVLCLFLFIAFAGMDWVTRIQKSLLILLLMAQVDMFIGSFIDVEYGTAYISRFEDGKYINIDQNQRHAFGYTGWSGDTFEENLNGEYIPSAISSDPSFMELYGVFFTAVTGIVAGANLSGDLKDPAEAIPKGTLLAIGITYCTYMFFGLTVGTVFLPEASGVAEEYIFHNEGWQSDWGDQENITLPKITDCDSATNSYRNELKDQYTWYDSGNQWNQDECVYGSAKDQMTMTYISFTGYLRYAGGFSASLSSAIASLVGAPRVLQAVGVDKIYPGVNYFAKGANANNDPYRGYLLVFAIAMALCMIASLNAVGVIASNFFLAAYALMNLSCFHSSITKAPSWRPAYKWYNPWVSLLGAVLCVIIMFLMNWIYAGVTILVLIVLGMYIYYRNPDANWGSSTQGQVFVSAVRAAVKVTETPDHVKNYRPKVLVLTGNPAHRPPLVNFAGLITKSSSLLICGHVLEDPRPTNLKLLRENVQRWMSDHNVKGFYSVVQDMNRSHGAKGIISLAGLGKLTANLTMIGFKRDWNKDKDELEQYREILNAAFESRLGVSILRVKNGFDYSKIIGSEEMVDTKKDKKKEETPVPGPDAVVSVASLKVEDEIQPKSRRVSVFRGTDGNFLDTKHLAGLQMFQTKKYTGFIDVWWLYDDGGLTLLLPYILTTRKQFEKSKLRVFALANKANELDKEQRNLAALLAKFRIKTSEVIVIPDITRKANDDTRHEFESMIAGQNIDERQLLDQKEKTNRHLRLAELLRSYSSESDLIVMTLPTLRRDTDSALYMAWLDIMTKDLPPTLLLRGNQESVLTFYS